MCGIAGFFGTRALPTDHIESTQMLMRRRGPDHQGYRHWVNPDGKHVYLLHSRLSIIDLDVRSNQPFRYRNKWIVQNGELYNYLELRESLVDGQFKLQTQSDTEVLLASLACRGDDALESFEGMWAFALFDTDDGSLKLCRDRFGEKPLYLYRAHDGIYFGSEVKFIKALLGQSLQINTEHLLRYLVHGYKSLYKQQQTFFLGVEELSPGTILTIDARGAETVRRYWNPSFDQNEKMSFDDAVLGAREKLIRSVELRLRSHVPLAFCMSGGVDSISLISIAKRVFDYDVHGFTINTSDARYDESDMVTRAVKDLGLRHTSVTVESSNFLARLRDLIRYHDAPVYTVSYYVHWLLMQTIAEHGYRISVSGTGADELFSGYYDHHLSYLYEIRNQADLYADSKRIWQTHVLPTIRNPDLQDPDRYIVRPEARDHIFDGSDRFREFLHQDWTEEFSEASYTGGLLRNRMANELFHESVPVILHEDDLNAMHFSIENRSPFLDRNMFEFCNKIPTGLLIKDGRTKAVLREAVRPFAPAPIIDNRRKIGFNAPILSLLDLQDQSTRNELLSDSPIFSIVRRDKVKALLDQSKLSDSTSKFLFNFVCAKLFTEEF